MNNKSSICLNMIVKDESHIIKQTLDNICSYIDFSYWVISDTGSTDGTQEYIKEYFKEKNIPGELFEDEWRDFAYNRNLAIEHAFNKSDYLFFFDADDLIHGDFKLPDKLTKDVYQFKFSQNFSYDRICLINNREKIGKYVGVLHELFHINKQNSTIEKINGNYYFESRHLGDRSKNPDKYKKDGETLEIAFSNENTDLGLKYRYAYYCGQSYQDGGITEKSIEWYKKFLDLPADNQYKYCACINLGHNYKDINNEESIYYYGLAYKYDTSRIEGITFLMDYYYKKGLHYIVSALWHKFKNYEILNPNHKIFLNIDRYKWFEWYNIVSGFYSDDYNGAYTSCKRSVINNYNIPNVLQNLIFYKKQYDNDNDNIVKEFLFNYIKNNNDLNNFNRYSEFIKGYNIEKYNLLYDNFNRNNIDKSSSYKSSNKILIYTGYMNFLWNDSTLKNKSLGGAEKAVIYLSRCLPKNYEIFIAGDQLEEEIDNIKYVNHNNLQNLLNNNNFHTIIVSRYVSFFEEFKNIKCGQLVVSAHDTYFLGNNNENIIKKHSKYIDIAVCLTEWHKNEFIVKYNCLKDKFRVINNGINIIDFNNQNISLDIKVKNKFVWSSRPERGLNILLDLWPKILEKMPDATLDICSYDNFTQETMYIKNIIDNNPNIKYHGKLNTKELYKLINNADYWLYTCTWPETSCITAMEMLMCEVVCLYYPIAGLVNTIGDYGIKVERGNEIESILNLSRERKIELREKGKEYALSCSWENRAEQWSNILRLNKKKWIFYCSPYFETKMIQQYIDNLNCDNPDYVICLTNDKNKILSMNPSKITFVYEVFDDNILSELPNTQFSFLNTEPLNILVRLEHTTNILKLYPNWDYYDYSESNLKILEENEINIQNKIYLPYKCSDYELKQLINLNKNTKKEFDFGIIKTFGGVITERRLKIVNFLKENNFTVNIIDGWNDDRDMELAKCKIILNIHGNLGNTISYIFEHIRCNRLLESGFNILSENSYKLDEEFVNKYPNLKQIIYEDFFNIPQIIEYYNNKLGSLAHNNYVLNILKDTYTRIDIPQVHINFLKELKEHLNHDNMIIYDIGSSVLHWTQHASKIWNNSKIYLFDAMTEMMLFYDEYNKQNNTNYEYNVGVLCDEDYKRISFYQNDELSGGNSYYKEIGHPNSANIFTEDHIKHKVGMKLETIVKNKNIPMPDLVKIDVQGAELDILKGSMNIINNAKFLIVELQHTEYNKGAPLCNQTRDFLVENGWKVYAEKFSNNGPDADWCFINTKYKIKNNIREYRRLICNDAGQTSGSGLIKYVKNCIDKIGVTNIVNICDVGCGIGEQSKALLSQYPNFKFTGVDWSQSSIDYLKQNTSFFDEIVHCKSSNLPFNNKQFSVALSMESLEHLYSNDAINAFKELKRISEYIIITIPRPEWIVNIPWLNKEILEATNDDIPLTLRDFISLESCVHKIGYYENSLINAGFIKCDIEHPYNGIYYCKSIDLDICKIQYTGINSNNLLQTNNYKEKYIDLLHKSLNLKFIQNNITPKLNKIIIFGFPHSGTTILKSIIGNCDNVVIENIIETNKIVNIVNNKFNLCKVAFADEKYFQEEYNDYIKIFIMRNPVFIFSSLNRRLNYNPDKYHDIENYFKILKLYDSVNYNNVYKIKYEDLFDNNYKNLKCILDNIGIEYNNDIFKNNTNNNKFDINIKYDINDKKIKEKSFAHLKTWQINQPFVNMNDMSNINLTEVQKNKLLNNKLVLKLFPDVCKILNTESQSKIIDCFIFYNELELLTYRLNILNDFVDFFVIGESNHTFVGKEKPLFYLENKHLFEKFNDKIIHIIIDDFPHKYPNINFEKNQQWNNEIFQRNCISRGLDKLSLQNNDIIIITDADEIPNPKILQQIKNKEILVDQNILELDFYYFNLESRMDHQWRLSKIISYKNYKELGLSCEQIRQNMSFQIIKNSGWHLSYFGDVNFIKNKIQNFSHQELNNDSFATEEKIKERMDNKVDNYGNKIIDIKIEDNNNLPPYYDIYLTKFYTTNINSNSISKNIAFWTNQLCERGTTVASYDYAYYNQTILGNKSYIFYDKNNPYNKKEIIEKFKKHFIIHETDDFKEVDEYLVKYNISHIYIIKSGAIDSRLSKVAKNCIHCVFTCSEPHGEVYSSIAPWVEGNNNKYPVVPHMVNLPKNNNNMREKLNIPENAIVFGGYGGNVVLTLNLFMKQYTKLQNRILIFIFYLQILINFVLKCIT